MLQRLKKLRTPGWELLAAIAGLALLAYGLLIPWLGFYWDDLSYQYSLHVFGPFGYVAYVARDRPFSAWIYVVTSTLFGDQPLPYQLLNLGLRIACAAALGWLLRSLWPRRAAAVIWAPLAFVVYPGFWQQPVSFIYNLHWANLAQELFSLGCMLRAVRSSGRKRLGWSAASIVLMLNVFSLEYAFGLEGLRPLLLFLALGMGTRLDLKSRLWKTLKHWWPYLLVNGAFLVWTLVIFNNNLYDPGGREQAAGLVERLFSMLRDLFQTGLLPWLGLFDPLGELRFGSVSDGLFWLAAGAGGLGSGLFALWLTREGGNSPQKSPGDENKKGPAEKISREERREEERKAHRDRQERAVDGWSGQMALVGLWALVVAGIPIWGVGLDPETRFPYDRFTLPFSIGAAILLAAFLEGVVRGRLRKVAVFGLVMGLAVGAQFQNTNTFRREWTNLSVFLEQLAARAPGLEPGTLLLTHDLPLTYYSDYSLSGVLNMQYAPNQKNDGRMPYFLMYMGDRAGGSLPGLEAGMAVEKNYRSLDFSGSTSQAVVIVYSPPGCLRILDPARAHELPDLPDIYIDALPLSRPELILAEAEPAAVPPSQWFQPADGATWCAAYERADLARQRGDWQAVMQIGVEALGRGLSAAEFSEMGVFAEAAARLGDEAEALALLQPALSDTRSGKLFACKEWAYLVGEGLVGEQELGCPALP